MRETWPFKCVVLQKPDEECTKIYNTCTQPLGFCSFNILFGGVLVVVAVLVCLASYMAAVTSSENTLLDNEYSVDL